VTTRNEIAAKPVVYQIPGMDAAHIRRDIPYQTANADLVMDIYRPPDSKAATRLPAVVFVMGYSDLGAEKIFGCKFKEMEAYVDWAKLIAASGLAAEKRIGLWSGSGNVPRALGLLMQNDPPALKCAALCYGYMLDLNGSNNTAEAAKNWRFANPRAGKSIRDLPPDMRVATTLS
jgi:hypothetical protein